MSGQVRSFSNRKVEDSSRGLRGSIPSELSHEARRLPCGRVDGVAATRSHQDAIAATALTISPTRRADGPEAVRNGSNSDQRPPTTSSRKDDARRWRKRQIEAPFHAESQTRSDSGCRLLFSFGRSSPRRGSRPRTGHSVKRCRTASGSGLSLYLFLSRIVAGACCSMERRCARRARRRSVRLGPWALRFVP